MMEWAIGEAKRSRQEGNKGYGAVITLGQQIVASGRDTANTENDPSLHAEVNAIRRAVRVTGDADLCGAILFTTCEPCPMCSALAVCANVTTIMYGASIKKTAQLGKKRIMLRPREIIERSPVMVEVIGDILAQECIDLYQ